MVGEGGQHSQGGIGRHGGAGERVTQRGVGVKGEEDTGGGDARPAPLPLWRVVGVLQGMALQERAVGEGPVADIALEGTLGSVSAHVHVQ